MPAKKESQLPAQSSRQANTARMAMAHKHGHLALKDIPAGAREAVQSMSKMAEDSLKDFMHTAKPKAKTILH
jgi:hypothetical protein